MSITRDKVAEGSDRLCTNVWSGINMQPSKVANSLRIGKLSISAIPILTALPTPFLSALTFW